MGRARTNKYAQLSAFDKQRREMLAEDFIRIELKLADTFCKLALQSHSQQKRQQHWFNARRAIDGAVNALARVQMESEQCEDIMSRIATLNDTLEAGEKQE
jgi:hypothetical protein